MQMQDDRQKDFMPHLASVVLPTYNRAPTLERAIESVLNQTFTDFELIIVDDGSTDETSLILGKYAGLSNVRLIVSCHRGCAAARNIGVSHSQGRYIAFQDSDDEWMPDKLAKAVLALEDTGPETGVFYSDMCGINADGTSVDFKSPDVVPGVLVDECTLDYQFFGVGIQSAVIKRKCLEEAGCFDEALERFIDLEIFIRLSDKFRFIHCKEPLIRYYAGEGISTDRQALAAARLHLLRKYHSRLRGQKHHLANQYLLLSAALKQNGEKYKCLTFLLKAFLASPRHAKIHNVMFEAVRRQWRKLAARFRA
jgi:glycosyltransferase involved in cell wall biosynthesis